MRGIRRKIKEEKPALLPQIPQFLYLLVPMYARIVEHDERVSFYAQGKVIEVLNDLVRVNAFSRGESMIAVVPVYHAEDVDSLCLLGRDIHIFVTELPAVRHIAFGAYMTFIGIIEVYFAVSVQMFKFLQLLALIRIELRRGYSPWAFPYSLISCANADKKRLNVRSLASLPVAFCQASLALLTLWIGLRPRPGRVCRPLMPSAKKRFTQKLTDTCDISVCKPMALLEKPADLSSTARQRIRKQWLEPFQDFMEIINIDAQVFQEMKNALAQVIKEIQDRNFFNESLEGWLDGQDVCLLMDISPRKLLSLRSTGVIPFSRIDKKIYYQKKDILEYMKRELQKESLN